MMHQRVCLMRDGPLDLLALSRPPNWQAVSHLLLGNVCATAVRLCLIILGR